MDAPTVVAHLGGSTVEYRHSPTGRAPGSVVVVLHGGHLRAGMPLGEKGLRAAGHSVLAPSRPGYGRTDLASGPEPERFADLVAQLCTTLAITRVRAVVGVSAGGPTAAAMAERHPDLVDSLLLVSARSALPFPTGPTRLAARLAFGPRTEGPVWTAVRALLRRSPVTGVRAMMGSLSTLPARQVVDDLRSSEVEELVELFSGMRSGAGFHVDISHALDPFLGARVRQPALVVASRHDGQVGWEHAEQWHRAVPGSALWESPSLSHLVWFGSGAAATEARILEFLAGAV